MTAPGSVIRHSFGGSGGAKATGFFLLNYRNWLLTVLRNADAAQRRRVARAVRERVWWAVRANLASPLRRRRRPSTELLVAWIRTLSAVVAARRRQATGGVPPGAVATDEVTSRFRPAFGPRTPSTRPGGPLLVYLDIGGAGPWRALLVAARDDVEIVPVRSAEGPTGLRTATVDEVVAALDPDRSPARSAARAAAPAVARAAVTLGVLSTRSCVLRLADDGSAELSVVGEDGTAAAEPRRWTAPRSADGGGIDTALLIDDVLEGYRQLLG